MSREREFFINYVKKFTKFETLDRTALVRPIIKIYIYEDRTIHIHYNFRSTKEAWLFNRVPILLIYTSQGYAVII